MKLLIITQKIDINDDVLGFMHGWVLEFAKHCERVTVIVLGVGEYKLPQNVKVLSLGKERLNFQFSIFPPKADQPLAGNFQTVFKQFSIFKKLKYTFNFYKYIWQERNNYDKVFVHMNKEYVILAGLFWKIWRKKTALWYNHLKGDIFSRISGVLADVIFYTSPFSFFSNNKKARMMPAGIDTNIFKKISDVKKIENSLLFLGRISPVKNLETLIGTVKLLNGRGINFILNIVGEASVKNSDYFEKIKKLTADLENNGKIKFFGKVPNYKTPEIYNQNDIFINLTNSGSFDKTILEAMTSGSLVITSNKSFEKIFPREWHGLMIFREKDEKDLAEKIIKLSNLSAEEKENIKRKGRELVVDNHSVKKMAEESLRYLNNIK